MFNKEQFRNSLQTNLRAKDAQCLGFKYDPQIYCVTYPRANNVSDSFTVNGEKYKHIFPQIGDIIVGIATDEYCITNNEAICQVVECGYENARSLSDNDIKIRVLNFQYSTDFWVRSIFFRYATEAERGSVRR